MTDMTLICIAVGVLYCSIVLFIYLKTLSNSLTIKPNEMVMKHRPVVGWFTIVGGVMLFALGVAVLYFEQANLDREAIFGGLTCSIIGFVCSTGMMPSMSSANYIVWTEDYVEGPNQMLGPTLTLSRIRCSWDDIVKMGQTFTGYNYFETKSGDRIYWSSYSQNVPEFYQKLYQSLQKNDAH